METKHFIHIPKNAGMTVRRSPHLRGKITLSSPNTHISPEYTARVLETMNKYGQHHGYEHARWRDLNETYRNRQCFAIVRNPWSKVVSRYMFLIHTDKQKGIDNKTSFEEFLEQRHTWGNVKYFWHRAIKGWYQQKDHVTDTEGNLRVDVLRFEHFNDDMNKYFNLNVVFDRRGVSNIHNIDYRTFYTPQTKDIIEQWYAEDIEYFGFTYDGTATKNIWNIK